MDLAQAKIVNDGFQEGERERVVMLAPILQPCGNLAWERKKTGIRIQNATSVHTWLPEDRTAPMPILSITASQIRQDLHGSVTPAERPQRDVLHPRRVHRGRPEKSQIKPSPSKRTVLSRFKGTTDCTQTHHAASRERREGESCRDRNSARPRASVR